MGMMFFLEINVMVLSPLFVEVWHAVEFRRTLLDLCKDVKHKQGKSTSQRFILLVLLRKQPFSDERDQLSALSHQQNTCKNNILN